MALHTVSRFGYSCCEWSEVLAILAAFTFVFSSWTKLPKKKKKRGSQCLQALTVHCFHWVLDGLLQTQHWPRCVFLNVKYTFERVSFEMVFMEVYIRCFLFLSLVVECFLSIYTGRACLACETSVMQQLSTHFLLTFSVFCGGLLCSCCSYSSCCIFHMVSEGM